MSQRVFLSFDSDDLDRVNLFRGQAKNSRSDLDFADYSVKEAFDSHNAEYIRRQIGEQISPAGMTICLIGRNTHRSSWVDWELRTSSDMGKRLLGVQLYGRADTVPAALQRARAPVLGWDVQAISKAIGS